MPHVHPPPFLPLTNVHSTTKPTPTSKSPNLKGWATTWNNSNFVLLDGDIPPNFCSTPSILKHMPKVFKERQSQYYLENTTILKNWIQTSCRHIPTHYTVLPQPSDPQPKILTSHRTHISITNTFNTTHPLQINHVYKPHLSTMWKWIPIMKPHHPKMSSKCSHTQ